MHDLLHRIVQLSPGKQTLLAQRLRTHTDSEASAASTNKKLVAYVVPQENQHPEPADLRRFLKAQLPDYMVPAAFVLLNDLPRTPNGKVDRRALPDPEPHWPLAESLVPPRNATEETLAAIWADVLGVERVGVHDNFFEMGGDSILSIQIIAKARQANLDLTPDQLFQYQTIAELAAVAPPAPTVQPEQGPVMGPVPLTPIQHWFFEQPLTAPHHWNQTLWLEASTRVDARALKEAVQRVALHHDALRLRFVRESADWRQFHADLEAPVSVTCTDLSTLPEAEQSAAMEETAARLQAAMDLGEGPLMQVALFRRGATAPDRLLISIHHLIVDPLSWQILLEDLGTAYGQLSRSDPVRLPRKTSSFKDWTAGLAAYVQSDELRTQRAYWLSLPDTEIPRLPEDHPGTFTEASARTLSVSLSAEETWSLQHDIPAAYNTRLEDVLLAALVQSFAAWTEARSLWVGLERHGRAETAKNLDLSRTVGWFTAFFPVLLTLEDNAAPGEVLMSIKEQLRRIPDQGIGYGVLRYMGSEGVAETLQSLPHPDVIFNYTGQADALTSADAVFQPLQPLAASRSPLNRRDHLLEINAFIVGHRLKLNWTYSANVHRPETVERVAQRYMAALQTVMTHCLSSEADGYTPSDFPEADLSQEELNKLLGKLL